MARHAQKIKSHAEIVDGKLILSCPNAVKPVVWQMDLSSVKASALEVDNDKDGKHHALFLKSTNGERASIVSFDTKKAAIDTLMQTSNALIQAQGRINSSAISLSPKSGSGKILKIFGFLILGGFLTLSSILIFNILTYKGSSTSVSPTAVLAPSVTAPPENGVPLSADDFLRRR